MADEPLSNRPNGDDDRDERGRFRPGCRGGPGNPHARAVARWRREWLRAVTPEKLRRVIDALLVEALQGERWAVEIVLSRTLGQPPEAEQPTHGSAWSFAGQVREAMRAMDLTISAAVPPPSGNGHAPIGGNEHEASEN